MKNEKQLKREKIAKRIVKEFPDNSLVNLGIGLPTLCADFLPDDKTILLHSENGFTGLGKACQVGQEDADLINAGGAFVTIQNGGCFFDSTMSFGIIRGGHLDATVLGALEVDSHGNLANYMIPGKMVPGMGGAMDLVTGAKKVIIAMEHIDKHGNSKILEKCSLPLTGVNVVDKIVTDLAVISVTKNGLLLEEISEDTTLEFVIENTKAKLTISENLGRF
ncbi:MAG: 3-oxoacid CoA-transferase subunit B [Candidatus Muirbacterium halophilum]|nr:3-oxoacid CoA-transferase subunit B [Candidatus Muirbacterium halophilum]MCK9475143.1 3-oxoacid CoA-transferase subunit B [Candidatus Muirbacterium halophilum]